MPRYRFCLHAGDERLVSEEAQLFPSEAAAIKFAHVLLSHQPVVMVWCENRLVRRVARGGPKDRSDTIELI